MNIQTSSSGFNLPQVTVANCVPTQSATVPIEKNTLKAGLNALSSLNTQYTSTQTEEPEDDSKSIRRALDTSEPNRFEHPTNGEGAYTFSDGSVYRGSFVDGECSGKGTITFSNGDIYTGDFLNDLLHGHGTLKYRKGGTYVGEFQADMRWGKGTRIYQNGDEYTGDFVQDLRVGTGILKYKSGGSYDGEFVNDQIHGNGTMIFQNNDIFMGKFENCKRTYGVLTYKDGEVYEGEFKDDWYNGKGERKERNGNVYVGDFVKGYYEGHGKYTYPNGDTYDGQFKKGMFHGKGTYFVVNISIYTGEFFEGHRQGTGKYTYLNENGKVYEGAFKLNNFHGKGVLSDNNGIIWDGFFIDGRMAGKKAVPPKIPPPSPPKISEEEREKILAEILREETKSKAKQKGKDKSSPKTPSKSPPQLSNKSKKELLEEEDEDFKLESVSGNESIHKSPEPIIEDPIALSPADEFMYHNHVARWDTSSIAEIKKFIDHPQPGLTAQHYKDLKSDEILKHRAEHHFPGIEQLLGHSNEGVYYKSTKRGYRFRVTLIYGNGESDEGSLLLGVNKIEKIIFHSHFVSFKQKTGDTSRDHESSEPELPEYLVEQMKTGNGKDTWNFVGAKTKAIYTVDPATHSIEFSFKNASHTLKVHRLKV
jgi:hypothetical protein